MMALDGGVRILRAKTLIFHGFLGPKLFFYMFQLFLLELTQHSDGPRPSFQPTNEPFWNFSPVEAGSEVSKRYASVKLGESEIGDIFWVVVSNIFYFYPYLGKIPILTNIFQRG